MTSLIAWPRGRMATAIRPRPQVGLGLDSRNGPGPRRMEPQRRVLPSERHAPPRPAVRRPDLGRHTAPEPHRRSQFLWPHYGAAQQLLQRRCLLTTGAGCPRHRPADAQLSLPGIQIFDAVVSKEIAARDGQRVEIRVEAQNVLNRPIFRRFQHHASERRPSARSQARRSGRAR